MAIILSNPQSKIVSCRKKYVACAAGLGSGKSFTIALKMLMDYFTYKGAHLCYLAPTYSLISDIIYPLLEGLLQESGVPYSLNKTDSVLVVPGYGRIFFRSMSKPERIIGFSILKAYMDEIDVIPAEQAEIVLEKIIARLRQVLNGVKNQVYLISSPEGFGFMYNNFEKDPLEDSELIRMSTYDNVANLPPDYIDTMLRKYPASLVQAYIYGMFVNLKKLPVWAEYDRIKNRSTETVRGEERLHIGMDFNVGKMCSIVHVMRNGLPHAVDEFVGLVDTPAMIDAIQIKYPTNPVTAYPDASGKHTNTTNAKESDINLLREAKFRVNAKRKNPLVKDRVTAANAMFCNGKGERRYKINDDLCPTYAEALEKQVYDDKGVPIKDGKYDNTTDAGTYPIYTLFPIRGGRPVVEETGGL